MLFICLYIYLFGYLSMYFYISFSFYVIGKYILTYLLEVIYVFLNIQVVHVWVETLDMLMSPDIG